MAFSSRESGRCVILVIVKRLLRCINHRDNVTLSRMTDRILTSTGLGYLISELLDLGRANSNLEAISLSLDGVYERGGE